MYLYIVRCTSTSYIYIHFVCHSLAQHAFTINVIIEKLLQNLTVVNFYLSSLLPSLMEDVHLNRVCNVYVAREYLHNMKCARLESHFA